MAQVFEVNKDVTSEHFRAAATASSWRNGESAGRPLHFNISKRGCFSSRPSVDDGSELNDVHVESCTGRQTAFVGHKRSPRSTLHAVVASICRHFSTSSGGFYLTPSLAKSANVL
ncbi:hypothetical protein F441_10171 [Phytophthora nicotianae CJ01A1]|uniref:Uncharacterized protein n=4 Tax=Phytophthora nicotianae TaxID=4792 RepID=W2R8F5_PHYN3|nr:hypothetical protein PPTG_21094 [Phytophthora nicotianae INRA-310]ETK85080.1 hypothetical protein L915_10013 [Phytophthora nicotianae]ETP14922.1 hypothetical protein F441_10171 [Phytophthora nicotianae CJ01A1]ETP42988.1 hypothetical protein F442_10138 [Phytophthora nicotianae P10297]ETL38504.1 hypothetical protein L916_09918 [Phytophthora nicotianae]ETL91632.1 hypothetical protein L917_09839 [Phytophthora nicotianae]